MCMCMCVCVRDRTRADYLHHVQNVRPTLDVDVNIPHVNLFNWCARTHTHTHCTAITGSRGREMN